MEIFYNEEDQKFHTIPDGDIATHQQINEYFKTKINNIESKIPVKFTSNLKGDRDPWKN